MQIELGVSLPLALCVGLVTLLAALAAALATMAPPLRFGLPLLALAYYAYFLRNQVARRGRRAVCRLAWDALRGWRVASADGDWQAVVLRRPVFVSYRLVIARFKASAWCTRTAVIVTGCLSTEEFRRLRVRLLQAAEQPD